MSPIIDLIVGAISLGWSNPGQYSAASRGLFMGGGTCGTLIVYITFTTTFHF